MNIILSHKSALELWRNTAILKTPLGAGRQIKLEDLYLKQTEKELIDIANKLQLTLPLNLLCKRKQRSIRRSFTTFGVPTNLDSILVYDIAPGVSVVDPYLCLAQNMQGGFPFRNIELIYEFSGSYSTLRHLKGNMATRPPLISLQNCNRACCKLAKCHGIKLLRLASKYVTEGSRSPMETKIAIYLTLPCSYGGKNLKGLRLNQRIDLSIEARRHINSEYLFCDLYWPEYKLALEYDSDQVHLSPEQHARDMQRRAALKCMGIEVISIGRSQARDKDKLDATARILAKQMNIRLRCDPNVHECASLTLHQALFFESPN